MKKSLILLIALFLISLISTSQNANFVWAKGFGGSIDDISQGIATDASGNVYTIGVFADTVDFNPGVPGYTVAANGSNNNTFLSKMNSNGNLVWVKTFGAASFSGGKGIVVDPAGNIYLTGMFSGTVDFDPGPSVFNLVSNGGGDIYVSKFDASGNLIWAKSIGGAYYDVSNALILDGVGNIYYTGRFYGTVDFDPGSGVYNLSSVGTNANNLFISKLDPSGNFVWAKSMGGGNSEGNSIGVDGSGNVYTTGDFAGTVDFDPGAGTFSLTSTGGNDFFVNKLDLNGNFIWTKMVGGANNQVSYSLLLDGNNNIYITGGFDATVDFDPGAGVYNLASAGNTDGFILKLNSAGSFIFAKQFGGTSSDNGRAIVLDNSNNIYTTGGFVNTADFDPGPSVYNLTTAAALTDEAFISKLDSTGAFVWAKRIASPSSSYGWAIAADNTSGGNIYLAGQWQGVSDFDPSSTTYTLASHGGNDAFIEKFCQTPNQPLAVAGNTVMCSGVNATFSVAPVTGATSYSWNLPGGWNGTSTTNIITSNAVTGGIVSVEAGNSCGYSAQQTLSVLVNPTPTISLAGGGICPGNSFTLNPSGANTYTYLSGSAVVSPTVTTSYSVSGTSSAGCLSNMAVATVTVSNTLTVTITGASTVCSGQAVNLTAGGASTYTWNNGTTTNTIAPVPTANTSYSVIGASGNCSNTAMVTVSVNPSPTVNVVTNNTLLCTGQSATITVSGANSYSWNTGSAASSIIVSPTVSTTYTVTGTATNGCMNSSAFTQSVSTCTSLLGKVVLNSQVQIFPNPFNTIVTVSGNNINDKNIYVYNVLGVTVYSARIEGEKTTINFEDQPKGIYFISIGSTTRKIIKE